MKRRTASRLFPYTTLFRSGCRRVATDAVIPEHDHAVARRQEVVVKASDLLERALQAPPPRITDTPRSEEHTSELQSRRDLVCRLLLEKKNWIDLHPRVYAR